MDHQAQTPGTGIAVVEEPQIRHAVGRQSHLADGSARIQLPGEHTVHTFFTDDGLVQGTVYLDFMGGVHYVVASRVIMLSGFPGDDMVATKQWECVVDGTADPTEGSDDVLEDVKRTVAAMHESTAERWQKMLAKVEGNQIPWA